MSDLLIVESPNKIKKLTSFLGDGWIVQASFGHIRDLPVNDIGVGPPDFRPQYVISPNAEKQVKKLQELAKKADAVWLAPDPDREGEAIAWHLLTVLNVKDKYKRVTFNEITKTAVLEAISSPRKLDVNLVKAQETRRILDRLVGYIVSPAITDCTGKKLSAGRVQSPAVRVIVEREMQITNFTPINHFIVKATFSTDDIKWHALLDIKPLCVDDSKYLLDKAIAEKAQAHSSFYVNGIEKKKKTVKSPCPFTTSLLQQAASAKLNLSPKKSMECAQKLFEQGLITYIRTDSTTIAIEFIATIRNFLMDSEYRDFLPKQPNAFKTAKDAQEAHEAIRPTDVNLVDIKDNVDDKTLIEFYKMIWQRTVASQMSPAIYDSTEIILNTADDSFSFLANGRVPVELGWRSLTADDFTNESPDDDKKNDDQLPKLSNGDKIENINSEVIAKKTSPPGRFTEASLIKDLEKKGIGRPSTYASILETIKARSYVELKNKALIPTEHGKILFKSLIDRFKFFEFNFTRILEEKLDDITQAKMNPVALMTKMHTCLVEEIASMQNCKEKIHCPLCKTGVLRRLKNKKNENSFFWSCSNYNNVDDADKCKYTAADINEQPSTFYKCPECTSGYLLNRSGEKKGKKYSFWPCNGYPECKFSAKDKNGIPDLK